MYEAFFKSAHTHSFQNREELQRSKIVGCFYCKQIYSAEDIEEWIPDKGGDTARCPKCGIDSVIGDASGIQLTKEFLHAMHQFWFERTSSLEDLKDSDTN